MEKKKYTEEEFVALLKNKDIFAYNALYDNYSSALFGVITRIIPTEEIAQDILQEVFIKIWKNFDSYSVVKGRLFTWMLNIARNSAIDYSRSKQFKFDTKTNDIENSVFEINQNTSIKLNVDTIGIREQVSALKVEYQILIDLIYFRGYTHEETAEELKIPLGTVKTRVRTAIQQLRIKLKS